MQKRRLLKWLGLLAFGCLALSAVVIWTTGILRVQRETGYFAPIFAADGKSVFAIRREVTATIAGLGYQMWTPPATVWLQRDRFALVNIGVADGRSTVIQEIGMSPLEGDRLRAYHGAIYGVPHAHLRWADGEHLEYEVGVTRHDTTLSRTFVIRRIWDTKMRAFVTTAEWREAYPQMGGDEPQQIFGDLEVIAAQGEESLPCGVALVRNGVRQARALIETPTCRRRYPSGLSPDILAAFSRRSDIERSETIKQTYADFVTRGQAAGLSEIEAMLKANKEMERLGFFPKSTTITARSATCGAGSPVFQISDEEFSVGLFSDIAAAIDRPGEEIDKTPGDYILHDKYPSGRALNAFLERPGDATFYVDGRGGCWQLTVDRP